MTIALETVDLGRRYMINWALRNCTLQVPEGSITGLVGPNGAGKSTLLRLAAGISRPSEGSVTVLGQRVNQKSMRLPKESRHWVKQTSLLGAMIVRS
jgi:ABC-2 type transport system ATP-binding protein